MEKMKEKKIKRIIVDTDIETHNLIRTHAMAHNISIKKYVLGALRDRILKEKSYGI